MKTKPVVTRTSNAKRATKSPTSYLAGKQCSAQVFKYLNAALAENTLLAYRTDLNHFLAWGGTIPAKPERVANYIAHFATLLAPSTLSRRLVAIAHAHVDRGLPSPTDSALVRAMLRGVRRTCSRPLRQVAPLQKADLQKMVRGLTGLHGLRDAALLLLGFAGAFRRSELVSLDVNDVEFSEAGMLIRIRRSKTDQEGQGRLVAIPRVRGKCCPTRKLEEWLKVSGISNGAIFRRFNRYGQLQPERLSAPSVALIVKHRTEALGLDSTQFSGHSLRAGFATNAAKKGASTASIRGQTGHKSDAMVNRYIRNSQMFTDNPVRKIW